ncbi:urease accessory protein UreH [Anoxybacillus geothermalis]|nr:urease accessory protein UreH [Anoxybacillus geothermalis]
MGTIWPVLLFGLLLGMKHATEPDHVIAVSTIASRTKKLSLSSLAGMFWGIGHTLTLLVVGMAMIAFERQIPEQIASYLEMGVGIMIVILGIASFRSTMRLDHHHQRDIHHLHVKSTLIGIVHGLAGSAGMVLLTMTTVKGTWMGLAFILIFGLGTVIGMMLFTTFLGIPFVWMKAKQQVMNQWIVKTVSLISIAYGVYYMYHIAAEI